MSNNTNKSPNRMTLLLNKIERRLGLSVLNLPEKLCKDNWDDIIFEDTIVEFSRYFPNKITVVIDNRCEKDGFYFVDKDLPDGAVILGVQDVDWQSYRADPRFDRSNINFATYDFISRDYCIDDVALSQVSADFMSLFNLGIYIEQIPPNKIKLVSVNGSPVSRHRPFPVVVSLQHNNDLSTISPTMMGVFERLAMADVATFLFNNLKYYDGISVLDMTVDLKLDLLQEWANKREDIINELKEAYITTANENQPMMMTV